VALAVFGLFALGLWMVGLDYYSAGAKTRRTCTRASAGAAGCHGVAGVWRLSAHRRRRCQLQPHDPHRRQFGHGFLYVGLFAVMIAGYLISTADGVGIPVFGLFEVLHWFPDYRTRQIPLG
jgi:cytochrome b561